MSLQQLRVAYDQCNKSMALLVSKLCGLGVTLTDGSNYTGQDFSNDWSNNGGKKWLEQAWRDKANCTTGHNNVEAVDDESDEIVYSGAEIYQGKHEWIPTDILGYVVEKCYLHKDSTFVALAEVLRTPTRAVVFKPNLYVYAKTPKNPLGLAGHVMSVMVKYSDGTYHSKHKKQAAFHDCLRKCLKANLNDHKYDVRTFWANLQDIINQWVWKGSLADLGNIDNNADCSCYNYNSSKSGYDNWGNTMGEWATKLNNDWANEDQILENNFIAFCGTPMDMSLS